MPWTKEQARAYGREWYKKNRIRQLAKAKLRHNSNPEARKASWRRVSFRKYYGITVEQYEEMKAAQNGCCLICGVFEEQAPRKCLVVDHCHSTGQVRGLLCNNCNALLGMAGESIGILLKAAEYLQ